MGDADSGELEQAFKTLKEITECPICLHPLHADTVMCVNGHVMCKGCQRDQKICPICKEDFSNLKQLTFVQQVLQVIPRPCRFKPCKVDVKTEPDHERFCKYRPIKCRVPSCVWEGPCHQLVTHFKADRPCNHGVEYAHKFVVFGGYRFWKSFDVDKDFSDFISLQYMSPYQMYLWGHLDYTPGKNTEFKFLPVMMRNCVVKFNKVTVSMEKDNCVLKSKHDLLVDISSEILSSPISFPSVMTRGFLKDPNSCRIDISCETSNKTTMMLFLP